MAWSDFPRWPRAFIVRTPDLNRSLSAARQRHSTMSEIAIAEIGLSGPLSSCVSRRARPTTVTLPRATRASHSLPPSQPVDPVTKMVFLAISPSQELV